MKFNLPFKISWKGITTKRTGQEITHSWLSIITNIGFPPIESRFVSLEKLTGFDYSDILSQWITIKYPFDHIIVLININVEAKNVQFWAKIPQTKVKFFLKDVVILRCKDVTEIERLIENIPSDFAEAYGYVAGSLIAYNKEEYL